MTLDPQEAAPRKEIVRGGDAPGAARTTPGGIILPPGVEPDRAPTVELPLGAGGEVPEDLPEYPRLRPVEIRLARAEGEELLLLVDPLGIQEQSVAVRPQAMPLLQLLDGTISLNEACALLVRETGDLNASRMMRQFVAQLDRMLLLDSDRFRAQRDEMQRSYHQMEFRQAALAGSSYPEAPEALGALLDRHFAKAETRRQQAGDARAPETSVPPALMAPHIDVRRGGATIARTYLEVGPKPEGPVRFVLLGTGHQLVDSYFALTRKHFETPFGPAHCDLDFVDALATQLGDQAYAAELAHRHEHSLEFQALYLRRRLGNHPFTIVPVLIGGFHELLEEERTPRQVPELERLFQALQEVTASQSGPTCFVAAVDFSHVGARFGDTTTLDDERLREIERLDQAAIECARRGDADGWFGAIGEHRDSTRICGFGAVYTLLRCLAGRQGRLLHYEQSLEGNGSVVSYAAMAWS